MLAISKEDKAISYRGVRGYRGRPVSPTSPLNEKLYLGVFICCFYAYAVFIGLLCTRCFGKLYKVKLVFIAISRSTLKRHGDRHGCFSISRSVGTLSSGMWLLIGGAAGNPAKAGRITSLLLLPAMQKLWVRVPSPKETPKKFGNGVPTCSHGKAPLVIGDDAQQQF